MSLISEQKKKINGTKEVIIIFIYDYILFILQIEIKTEIAGSSNTGNGMRTMFNSKNDLGGGAR